MQTLAERVRPHLAEIASRAEKTEDARCVPRENMDIIVDAGFVRTFVPKVYGGDERDLWDFLEGVRAVSKACPSTGWVTGVMNVHQLAMGQWDRSVQDEVYATGPDTLISSSGTPSMKAELVDGGYRVSGRGRWSSGCNHAEWIMVGAKVPDVSDAQFPRRSFRPHLFMAHRSDYTIEDTWHTMSMRGSGSNDLIFNDLFVPKIRSEEVVGMTFNRGRGAGTMTNWASRVPFPLAFACFFPAVALGCADGMIEEYSMRTRVRKSTMTNAPGVLHPASQMRLSESVHEIESLSAYLKELCYRIQGFGERGDALDEAMFGSMLHTFPFVTDRVVKVINRLWEGAGASAIFESNPLQRYWRDAQACRLHFGSDYDTNRVAHGRSLLGLPPTPDL
jgi:4-hydroxyphenylacetate 3-monooxygenase